jgi:hypothetical protein
MLITTMIVKELLESWILLLENHHCFAARLHVSSIRPRSVRITRIGGAPGSIQLAVNTADILRVPGNDPLWPVAWSFLLPVFEIPVAFIGNNQEYSSTKL